MASKSRENSLPAGVRSAASYVPEVESLRGIAILLVLFHHANALLTPTLADGGLVVSPLYALIAGGQTGVSLFFVLSAFCLSLPLFAEAGQASKFSLARFYKRRALRILPLYWSVVLVGSVACAATPRDLLHGVPYMFFANSFPDTAVPLRPFSSVWWSLATEVQFYLLLPLLPFCMRSRWGRWISVGALSLYAFAFIHSLMGGFELALPTAEIALAHSVLALGPIFLVGILVAWIYARHGKFLTDWLANRTVFRNGGADLALLACLFAMGCLLRWVVFVGYWQAETRGMFAWHVLEGLCWGSILLILLVGPLWSRPVFSNRVLGAIGVWSFSIYLIHLPLLRFSHVQMQRSYPGHFRGWNVESATLMALLIAACIALSAVTYRMIERPFLLRKARLGDEEGGAPEPVAAPDLVASRASIPLP